MQLSTNQLADTVEELFENDYNIEQQYHTLLNGELNFFSYNFLYLLNDFSIGKWDQCVTSIILCGRFPDSQVLIILIIQYDGSDS